MTNPIGKTDYRVRRTPDKPAAAPADAGTAAIVDFLQLLGRAARQFHTYPATSPMCTDAIDACHRAFMKLDIDGPFTDIVDLSKRLATSKQAEQCVAEQMATYAIGREIGPMTLASCADREIAKIVDDNGGRASSVFKGVVLNPVFATRVVGGP